MLDPIEELLEGNNEPLCLRHNETVRDALVKMVEHDYSQLPVIDKNGNLTGIVSDQAISRQYYHLDEQVSLLDLSVDHCQEEAVTLPREDSGLFEILERLKNSYAVVIVSERKPVGIVTDYDTTHFFRHWSEGLIRVQNIELTLRQYIEDVFPTEKALSVALHQSFGSDRRDPTKPRKSYDNLSFHDHLQLITNEKSWSRFEQYLKPKKVFLRQMEAVNQARNQLAHFRGSLDAIQVDAVIRAQQWLARRPKVKHVTKVVTVTDVEIKPSGAKGKYGPLQDWFSAQAKRVSRGHDIQRTFAEIENIIGESLPQTAREHRAWWANDSTSPQRHCMAWMQSGWKVENVDLTQEIVEFRRTDEMIYQLFFADLLRRLKEKRPSLTRSSKTQPRKYWTFSAGRTGFIFAWSFFSQGKFRAELYIDTEDKAANKQLFDNLFAQKEEIETAFGSELTWERLNSRRACRVYAGRNASITSSSEKVEELKVWAIENMLALVDTFQVRIKQL